MSGIVRVVVVDDSTFVCRLLTQYLESDPGISVVKTAHNGIEAMEAVKQFEPDVLTLDLNMPVLDGLGALERIMSEHPVAVVLISGVSKDSAILTEKGLSMGAVDFILKYSYGKAVPPETLRREIIAKVKAAAKVKVIRSIPSMDIRFSTKRKKPDREAPKPITPAKRLEANRVVIIGASTGGPLALKDFLYSLGARFPFPIVVIQHMPEKFTAILAAQFDRLFPFVVKEASQGETLTPGTVYIAPGDRHLLFNTNRTFQISMGPEVNGHRPSIDVAMQSAALVFGRNIMGVILSGMGNDGTAGLLDIKHSCGVTFAQSEKTCVIDAMPSSAINKGVVQYVGSPEELGRLVMEQMQHKPKILEEKRSNNERSTAFPNWK